jgi:hypothetical protein
MYKGKIYTYYIFIPFSVRHQIIDQGRLIKNAFIRRKHLFLLRLNGK